MPADPRLPLEHGSASLSAFSDPLLVDPDPPLLAAVVEAYGAAAPDLVDPDLSALRAAARGDGDPLSAPDLPPLTVLATERVTDAVTERFAPASRLAALAESGVCEVLTLPTPQPNTVLAGRDGGCVLVAGRFGDGNDGGDGGEEDERDPKNASRRWCRVGDDPTLRDRYDPVVAEATERRIRTPSRHLVYGAFRERCGEALAADVVRALDADVVRDLDADADANTDADGDVDANADPHGLDLPGARLRAYAVGARHEILDRNLRRACEDARLGSRATFTRIKRGLRDAGLVGVESVPQRVGRPRERLLTRGALADADGPVEVVAAVRDGTREAIE